jgi:threonine/homoserine/homoserine lactone efflux protein
VTGWNVNRPAVAGWVLWLAMLAWFVSPASPSWPETLIAAPVVLVAIWLLAQGRRRP